MNSINEISNYFSANVTGFVANKYRVTISSMSMGDLRFYVKKTAFAYEKLNTVEDIYVSTSSLARPRNVLSVNTPIELSISFRMDANNRIIKDLEAIFKANHNLARFEASGNKAGLCTVTIELFDSNYSTVYSKTYTNCTIFDMKEYNVDSSSRKFADYDVTFVCNHISPNDYKSTKGTKDNKAQTVSEPCAAVRDAWMKALKAFNAAVTSIPRMDSSDEQRNKYIKAIDESNILPAYLAVIKARSNGCPITDKLHLNGDNLNAKKKVNAAGIPDSEIIYDARA